MRTKEKIIEKINSLYMEKKDYKLKIKSIINDLNPDNEPKIGDLHFLTKLIDKTETAIFTLEWVLGCMPISYFLYVIFCI